MATDYDAPRAEKAAESEEDVASIEAIKARGDERIQHVDVMDAVESEDGFELPGADLSTESLTVVVTPIQDNEFTCSRCFLVQAAPRLVPGETWCLDCD